MRDVTCILSAIEQGDPHAAEQLLPLVYEELGLRSGISTQAINESPDVTSASGLRPEFLEHFWRKMRTESAL